MNSSRSIGIRLRSSPVSPSLSRGKKLLVFIFFFAYTVACFGIFFLRPTTNTYDRIVDNNKHGESQIKKTPNLRDNNPDERQQTSGSLEVEEVEDNNTIEQEEKVEEHESKIGPEMNTKDSFLIRLFKDQEYCLSSSDRNSEHGCPLMEIQKCDASSYTQIWKLSGSNLMNFNSCLDIYRDQSNIHICQCYMNENQNWVIKDNQITSEYGNKYCLIESGKRVVVSPCSPNPEWIFETVQDPFQKKKKIIQDRISKGGSGADLEGQNAVREMMIHAWKNYEKYAWGYDDLRPISRNGKNWLGVNGLAATIVDSLDTLYIMGLEDEYKKARDYVAYKLSFDQNILVSFFETTIRDLGGLLAAYAFTGDQMYVDKSIDLANRLLPAFKSPTGLPYSLINLQTGAAQNQHWNPNSHILAEIGTIQLEFKYLSELTGNPIYAKKADDVMEFMKHKGTKDLGLYPVFIGQNEDRNSYGSQDYTLGGLGDSYYEYILKQWIQSNMTDTRFKQWYDESAQGIKRLMIGRTVVGGEKVTYVGKYKNGYKEPKMEHLACFSGGMFALGAITKTTSTPEEDLEIGAELTKACRLSYDHQPSKLGPEKFGFTSSHVVPDEGRYYILRPEYVESLFYMWRFTKDPMYREWGWDVVMALEKTCKTSTGYCGVQDVGSEHPTLNDTQESFFLAETLKYLYLLFSEDSLVSLDKFVFNTEAHPLPIFNPKTFVHE